MAKRGSRNGGKGARSTIQRGKTGASGKRAKNRGVSNSAKVGKQNSSGKKNVQVTSQTSGSSGRRIKVANVHIPTEDNNPTKKSEQGKRIKGSRKITVTGKIKSGRAYKMHTIGRRSSNARNLSDDELRELGRIPRRRNKPRLRLVAANAGIVKIKSMKGKKSAKRQELCEG